MDISYFKHKQKKKKRFQELKISFDVFKNLKETESLQKLAEQLKDENIQLKSSNLNLRNILETTVSPKSIWCLNFMKIRLILSIWIFFCLFQENSILSLEKAVRNREANLIGEIERVRFLTLIRLKDICLVIGLCFVGKESFRVN
jgi:hypothetical protein